MLPGRCTGQCCAVFTLGAGTMEKLRQGEPMNADDYNPMGDDGPLLLAMLIPMTEAEAAEKLARLGFTEAGNRPPDEQRWDFEMRSAPTSKLVWLSFEDIDRSFQGGNGVRGRRRFAARLRLDLFDFASIRLGWRAYAWCLAPRADFAYTKRDIFGCRHWNEQTRLCDAYERRPWLCHHYPDPEHVCQHCGWQKPLVDRDPGDETDGDSIPRAAATW